MPTQKRRVGDLGETLAVQFLEKRGYAVLDRNYRKPWGEIDIVARHHGVMVFAEVKTDTRTTAGFEPELRAGFSKMSKVLRTAQTYLADKRIPTETEWRIDVITVVFDLQTKTAKIRHFPGISIL